MEIQSERYIGLPGMLKAGEYSPNNPLIRSEHVAGDALLGLGEYERRRNTLRKIRQSQYREYLDQQAKKKQEAKEQAERERLEQEERDRAREERERRLMLERDRSSPERTVTVGITTSRSEHIKVDTGVQVDSVSRPLSVGVQTDDQLYRLAPSPVKGLTQAERELSPRTVQPPWDLARRRSHGDFDDRTSSLRRSNRDKLVSDLRHSYMPSIFDADAIHMRNLQAEKEAAERRQFYQQELKNQILEQQKIREERKSREKMLEQAEMRRLEEQLRLLNVAQARKIVRHHDITDAMQTNAKEYDIQRNKLQREIDYEQQLHRATSQPSKQTPKRKTLTSQSDTGKLPLYYPDERIFKPIDEEKKPYSFNIPDNSIFSQNYDVDSYLRKNLNFKKHKILDYFPDDYSEPLKTADSQNSSVAFDTNNVVVEKALIHEPKQRNYAYPVQNNETALRNVVNYRNNEKTLVRNVENYQNIEKTFENSERALETAKNVVRNGDNQHRITEKAIKQSEHCIQNAEKTIETAEKLCIPLLRHSPKKPEISENYSKLSDAMKIVEDKWKVPAVQKNILKSLPAENGKNISILTQLGSIRRQLQSEQLRLDKMMSKTDN